MSDITTTWGLDARQFQQGAQQLKNSVGQVAGGLGVATTAIGIFAAAVTYSVRATKQYEEAIGDYYGSLRSTSAELSGLSQEVGQGWSDTLQILDPILSKITEKIKEATGATKAFGRALFTGESVNEAYQGNARDRQSAIEEGRSRRNADITDRISAARIAEERAGFGIGFTSPERMRQLIEEQNQIETEAAKRAVMSDRKMSEAERNARVGLLDQQGRAKLAADLRQFDVGQALATRASSDSVRSTEEQSRLQTLRLKNLKGEADLLGISLQYRKQILDVERNPALTGAERAEQIRRLATARDQLTEASAKDLIRSSKYDLARIQAGLPSITLDGVAALPGLSNAVFGPNTNQNAPASELVRSMEGLRNDIKAGTQALQKLNSGGGGPTYAP